MNWEAINAVAQLVSSLGVVASLWYLAVQVHRSTRVTKLAAQDAAAAALREVTRPFAVDPDSSKLWGRGLEHLESLSPEEKARFFHFAFQFLKAMETIHHHYINGIMEEEIWRGWRNLYTHYLSSPGLDYYWQRRQNLFSDRFQEFVASIEKPPRRMTVGNLLGETESTPGLP
jgi:hypothetical protein